MSTDPSPLSSLTLPIAFDRFRAEQVVPCIRALVAESRAAIDAIGRDPAPPTYAGTLGALEDATDRLERAMSIVGLLEAVATDDALRAAYNEVKPEVSALYTSIPLDPRLWARLRAFADTDEARALDGPRARFLEKTLADFRRHGAELDAAGKKRLADLDVELTMLTTKFAENVLDSTNAYELVVEDEARLAGLPESARAAARASATEKGKAGFRFTLQAPSFIPVLTYLDDRAIREAMWRAYNGRASEPPHDNGPIIERILELRREKAVLLGFADFADLVLDDRMAKRGARARSFIDDLRVRTQPFFDRERAELDEYVRSRGGEGAVPLAPWDVAYWSERARKERYDFDDEELRPYFGADRVVDGLFETARRLYGLVFTPAPELPTWDPKVRAFRYTGAKGTPTGTFYVDLYPRENKRGGAWMQGLVVGVPPEPHVALFCANVTPPLGDAPALLTHAEVETLFHEFGHLVHHLLSEVPVRSLGGTNVAWDFVELPSQIMENWCWEREALDFFARHHETGAPIPDELFAKMQRARTFRTATAQMRQIGFAALDLSLHVEWRAGGGPRALLDHARAILEAHAPASLPADYAMLCGFTHLFASPVGYAAGYYSYKWAEVLDADAFTRFQQGGVFSPEVGARFRDAILSRGDSRDPMDLYREFMGREPEPDALFERQGLR